MAIIPILGNVNSDQRGKMLEAIFREKQLNVMNNGSATHTSGTAIDLTVVLPGLTADISYKVLPSPLSSDHYPTLLDIDDGGEGRLDIRIILIITRENGQQYLQTRCGNVYQM